MVQVKIDEFTCTNIHNNSSCLSLSLLRDRMTLAAS